MGKISLLRTLISFTLTSVVIATSWTAFGYQTNGRTQQPPQPSPVGDAPRAIQGFTYAGLNAQGKHEYIHDKTTIHFLYIPGGTFKMGSPPNELGRDKPWGYDNELQHDITLSPYLMAKYEMTQETWEVFRKNPSSFKGRDKPVENVSWEDAVAFCHSVGLELPTEAQWEFACKAGTTGPYAGVLDEVCWHEQNSDKTTHAVGGKQANPWGLYDMHGNVWEWCRDWYAPYNQEAATDPTGPISGDNRVIRGGSWNVSALNCRSANRYGKDPLFHYSHLGFRPAKSLQ